MKSFFKRTSLVVTLVVILVLISSVAVYAAVMAHRTVPASVTIESANPDLELYTDASCSALLTSFTFGTIAQGDAVTLPVTIKNIGNKNFTTVTYLTDIDATVGTLTGTTVGALAKGSIKTITLTFTALSGAPTGAAAGNITVNGNY